MVINLSEKKLVLFDIDGTLTDSKFGHIKQFNDSFLENLGKEVNVRDFNISGATDRAIIEMVLKSFGLSAEEIEERTPKIFDTIIKLFLQTEAPPGFKPLPGTKKLLEALSKTDCRLALITGNPKEIAFEKMRRAGLSEFFSMGGFGRTVLQRSELIEMVLREVEEKFNEKYSGKQIVIIGDTARDIESAEPFGAKTIGVLTGRKHAVEIKASNADYIFKDLSDTEKVLEAIFSD